VLSLGEVKKNQGAGNVIALRYVGFLSSGREEGARAFTSGSFKLVREPEGRQEVKRS